MGETSKAVAKAVATGEVDLVSPPVVPVEQRGQLSLVEKIHRVMEEVRYVQKMAKGERGAEGLPYSFVSHDAVVRVIRPALVRWGIAMLPRVVKHEQLAGTSNTTVCDVEFTFVNVDRPDDRLAVPSFGYGVDKQDKGPGKAMSYAKKYALLQLFVLETGDDPEADALEREAAVLSTEQQLALYDVVASSGLVEGEARIRKQLENLAHALGFGSLAEVPANHFESCKAQLEKGLARARAERAKKSGGDSGPA